MFNGITHPSIALAREDGTLDMLRVFTYEDYRSRMDWLAFWGRKKQENRMVFLFFFPIFNKKWSLMKKKVQKFCRFKKKPYLCTAFREMLLWKGTGGNSSVGRARPCQGRGRGSESRLPLNILNKPSGEVFLVKAQVAELVDAHVSGACASRRAGSSPVLGTIYSEYIFMLERWRNW